MATDYDALWQQAVSAYNGQTQNQKLAAAGWTQGQDENGNTQYMPPDGSWQSTGDNAADYQAAVARATAGPDKQAWAKANGIMLTGYDPSSTGGEVGLTPEIQAAANKISGFNSPLDLMQYRTGGAGTYVPDGGAGSLGGYWIPQNQDTNTWNYGDVIADNARNRGPVNTALDNGAAVYALGAGVGALGAGAALGGVGGADALGGAAADIPYDVGANLVNNPELFGGGTIGAGAGDIATNALGGAAGDPYAGLGYSQADIEALTNGTYAGAEQTAAQSAAQLGSSYGLTQLGGPLQTLSDAGVPYDLLSKLSPSNLIPPQNNGNNGKNGTTANSYLANLLGVDPGMLDLLGKGATSLLGMYGANQKADAIKSLMDQQNAQRAPALNAYNSALANPNSWYQSAPAMGAADAASRALSVGGNPADNPGMIAKLAANQLGGYNQYLSSLQGAAFGGQSTAAQLGLAQADASGGALGAAGFALGALLAKAGTNVDGLLSKYGSVQPDGTIKINVGGIA